MALIKCTECGKEISDKAKVCPNCGCPIDSGLNADIPISTSEKDETEKVKNAQVECFDNTKKNGGKSNKLKIIAVVISLIVLVAIAYYYFTANSRKYEEAVALYNEHEFQNAAEMFMSLDDYKNSSEMANKCNYKVATNYFNSGDFEKALSTFEIIKEYSNSKEMMEKCEYEMSSDGKFMKALANGLMKRWDYSDKDYKKEYDVKSENDLSDSEYMAFLKKCVNFELNEISSFTDQEFNNKDLQKKATEYIELLNGCLKTIDYYSINNSKYSDLWNDAYNKRMLLIRTFNNDYNLVIDDEHQSTLDEFLSNASVVDEENKIKTDVEKMIDNIKYETIDEGYGSVIYKLTIENISDVTFEYFSLEIQLLDKKGNVIDAGYSDSISDFEPGKKATVEAYLSSKSDSIKGIASYTVKN